MQLGPGGSHGRRRSSSRNRCAPHSAWSMRIAQIRGPAVVDRHTGVALEDADPCGWPARVWGAGIVFTVPGADLGVPSTERGLHRRASCAAEASRRHRDAPTRRARDGVARRRGALPHWLTSDLQTGRGLSERNPRGVLEVPEGHGARGSGFCRGTMRRRAVARGAYLCNQPPTTLGTDELRRSSGRYSEIFATPLPSPASFASFFKPR